MNQDNLRLKSDRRSYDKAPRLQGSVLILMDMQVPYQDGEFVLRMLELAKKWKVKQGISGGDFFNQAAFSIFTNDPMESIWKTEAEKAKEVATVMVKYVPDWTFIMGNHDALLLRKLAEQLDHKDLMRLASMPTRVEATDYYWCIVVDPQGNEWRITHPRNISMIPGRVPQRLAEKYHQNIVSGHGHLVGLSPDSSGEFLCIDCGICCDPLKLDYPTKRDSLRPVMAQGAVILKEVDGKIYPYHILPQWADWDALGRLYR